MSNKYSLNHGDLVNLICGRRVPYGDNPYTKFTGNQWSESWEWDRDKISSFTEEELMSIYFGKNIVNLLE